MNAPEPISQELIDHCAKYSKQWCSRCPAVGGMCSAPVSDITDVRYIRWIKSMNNFAKRQQLQTNQTKGIN